MARVSTYLNFRRSTEEASNFYLSAFGTEFSGPIARFTDVPARSIDSESGGCSTARARRETRHRA